MDTKNELSLQAIIDQETPEIVLILSGSELIEMKSLIPNIKVAVIDTQTATASIYECGDDTAAAISESGTLNMPKGRYKTK